MKRLTYLSCACACLLLGGGCHTKQEQGAVQQSQPSLTGESQWPTEIPSDIPPLDKGHIDESQNLTPQFKVSYQPEKILFILKVSAITDSDIQSYFQQLRAASWKIQPASQLMTGDSVYRAEKGDHRIVIEENTYGKNTAYYYVYLSADATSRLSPTAPTSGN